MQAAHRILLLRFSSLGDVVLLSGLIDALHAKHPGLQLSFVTKERYAELFRADPRIHRLLELGEGRGALRSLRAALDPLEFDEVIDAHASLRSILLSTLLAPAPLRRLRKDALARWAFVRFRWRSAALGRQQSERYAKLVGLDALPPSRILLGARESERGAELLPGDGSYLAMAPGARHATKQWPLERYVELAREVQRGQHARIALFGGPGEEGLTARIAEELGDDAVDLCGRLSLSEVAACLARCNLLVCNDSGLLHLSEAVGTPVLALYGPTSRELGFFPRLASSHVIEHALPCRPCSRNGSRPCHMPENWCLSRSTTGLVHSQLELLWRRRKAAIEAT